MIEVNVKFKKKLYGSPDGDFSVFSAEPASRDDAALIKENKYGNISISGDYFIDESEFGRSFKVTIEEDYSSKYEGSYKLMRLHYEFPSDPSSQWEFLRDSGILSFGIFNKIKKTFSQKICILDLILEEPEKLLEVDGIGEERAANYQMALKANKEKAVLFSEYGKIEGVGAKLIESLYTWKTSVEEVLSTLERDPFSLITSLNISFTIADKFRAHYNIPLDDKNRILHGVKYYLNEQFNSTGDTYAQIMDMASVTAQKLNVSYKLVIVALAEIKDDVQALHQYKLKIFGSRITTSELFDSELTIYKGIKSRMEKSTPILAEEKWAKIKDEKLEELGANLSKEQNEFLDSINNNQIQVLLGPGGTGKSWVINIACQLLRKAGKSFALLAPTARAAKVMSTYVGKESKTIHRGLLPVVLAGEKVHEDVLIVDEFSMVDSTLAKVILDSMGIETRLIIVGDDYQLQSVAPGNVLLDLVDSLDVPTVRFNKVFRQADENGLLDYAQALRDGTFSLDPFAEKIEDNNIVFINENDDARKQEIALKYYKEALDEYDGETESIMMLTPSNKGPSGRKSMNKKIQEIVNPATSSPQITFGANGTEENKRYFRKNDYIAVTSNQYDMVNDKNETTTIVNGDVGHIIRASEKTLSFTIEDNTYTIEKDSVLGLLDHSWSITIHKSQGGQADIVIIVIPENASFMMTANMLYTAITRTKVKCYVIGNFASLSKAGKKQANLLRRTMLQLQGSSSNKQSAK